MFEAKHKCTMKTLTVYLSTVRNRNGHFKLEKTKSNSSLLEIQLSFS
jgi:hypothetical protein